jgi:catechol 2,3-dioxygenase-like lactoylglutathione lyase family enzyme
MNCTPMLVVRDVEASSLWYRQVLGATSGHGGDEFEMLMAEDRLLLMLHNLDFAEHPAVEDPRGGDPGRGVLLYVSVDDVEAVFQRARELGAELVDEPHLNPKARAVEFSVRDPDGYGITVSQWRG